jgi:hypothetical protein
VTDADAASLAPSISITGGKAVGIPVDFAVDIGAY